MKVLRYERHDESSGNLTVEMTPDELAILVANGQYKREVEREAARKPDCPEWRKKEPEDARQLLENMEGILINLLQGGNSEKEK